VVPLIHNECLSEEKEIKMKVWTVDAFAETVFTGNPAAVIPVERFPSDELCQKIAAEMNLSETAFVECKSERPFHIRWFTPKVEVKLCGHATLAAAHILFQEKLVKSDQIELESLSGALKVKKNGVKLTLDFPLQKTGPALDHQQFEGIFESKIISVVQAYDDVIVELKNESAVRELNVSPGALSHFNCRGIIVTAKGDGKYDFVSRFFAPAVGVDEDPVTGSAHCKLAHYWGQKLGKNSFLAYQASQRGGVLEVEISGDRVLLSGKAITVLKGTLAIG
jgi:PhzF family phenazine biosynthesis protein